MASIQRPFWIAIAQAALGGDKIRGIPFNSFKIERSGHRVGFEARLRLSIKTDCQCRDTLNPAITIRAELHRGDIEIHEF